jgi:acetyltransferase-like isoleucine patch superfamily enzyme
MNLKSRNIQLDKAFCGRGVSLREGCSFYGNPMLSGRIEIGRYTSINSGSRIFANVGKIIIGSFCSIGPNVILQEYNHNYNRPTSYGINGHIIKDKRYTHETISKGDIIIEDDCWLGANVVVLSGVRIGRGAIIGAGSVVTRDIAPYTIVGGNPAKKIKDRFSSEQIEHLEKSQWWTWSIDKIQKQKVFFLSTIK